MCLSPSIPAPKPPPPPPPPPLEMASRVDPAKKRSGYSSMSNGLGSLLIPMNSPGTGVNMPGFSSP